ncbi:RNA polymerase sigma 70 [Saccharopolyspora erythraea D]|nr:RNA polymerase sigma 70 [Saccharopolyspora erythraea D]
MGTADRETTANAAPAAEAEPTAREPRTEPSPLVDRCRRGDRRAWNELVRCYSPVIWTVARSYELSPPDCEDVCQMTWQRLVEHLPRLHRADRIRPWLVTVAKREAIRNRRVRIRTVPVADPTEVGPGRAAAGATPEEVAVTHDRDREVLAAFRLLPEKHQALLGMLVSDPGTSYDDVAQALRMPRGSVGPTRMRVLARMRDMLTAEDGSDPG